MAWTSGAMSTSNTYVKYTITIDEKSTSTANNTSNVTVSVRFYRTNSGYSTYGTGKVYCTINGTKYTASVKSSQKITNDGIVLFSKNLDVKHGSNGAKTLTVSASISLSGVVSSNSQSFSHALTTIPRASGLTVGNGTLGTKQTITADRKASSFTHTLTWKCGSYSGTIATQSTATSWTFTPELKLATGAPYGTKVSCEFALTTYNGNTSVGYVKKSVTLTIPTSVKPTISSLTLSDSKGYLATYGGYVQGQSVLKVVVNATKAQGSPISSYSTTVGGSTYTTQTFTTAPIKSAGTVAVKSTVKDGRGRSSNQVTSSITVLPYSVPKISKLNVKRCNQDGTDNDRGGHVSIQISYSITSLGDKNSKNASLRYKKTSDSEWTTSSLTASYSVSDQIIIVEADDAHSYDVQLVVQDSFATIISKTKVSTAYCLYHIPVSGKGITFGGVAEKDGFDVKMDARFAKGVEISASSRYITNNEFGLDLNNSDLVRLNSIFFADECGTGEGVFFPKENVTIADPSTFTWNSSDWMLLRGYRDNLYFNGGLVPTMSGSIMKVLWTGSAKTGTITVPDLDKYWMFRIGMSGQGTAIIAIKYGSYLRGIGGYATDTPGSHAFNFNGSFDGTSLTITYCSHINIATGSITQDTVTSINGLI